MKTLLENWRKVLKEANEQQVLKEWDTDWVYIDYQCGELEELLAAVENGTHDRSTSFEEMEKKFVIGIIKDRIETCTEEQDSGDSLKITIKK